MAARKYTDLLRDRQVVKEYLSKVKGKFPQNVICDIPLFDLNVNLPNSDIFRAIDMRKPSVTEFELISFDGTYSIVKCKPLTGRTHQIRKHLALLGYPIANDKLYKDQSFVELCSIIEQYGTTRPDLLEEPLKEIRAISYEQRSSQLSGKCPECEANLFIDPELEDLQIWLHSKSYKSMQDSWLFESPSPMWAINPT